MKIDIIDYQSIYKFRKNYIQFIRSRLFIVMANFTYLKERELYVVIVICGFIVDSYQHLNLKLFIINCIHKYEGFLVFIIIRLGYNLFFKHIYIKRQNIIFRFFFYIWLHSSKFYFTTDGKITNSETRFTIIYY